MSNTGTVFCSSCGAANQQPDSYCRSCGEWLPDMRVARRRHRRLRLRTPEERNRRMRLLEAAGAVAALTAAVLIFSALRSGSARSLLVFAADLCLVAFILQVVTFVIGRGLQKRASKGREEVSPRPDLRPQPRLAPGDPNQFVPPPSVTEHTTELLEHGRPRRSVE